jgi:ribosome-interacting GTPase 1
MLLCHDAAAPPEQLQAVRAELAAAGIELPALVVATRLDDADPAAVERLAAALPGLDVVGVSVLDDASLERLREALWRLSGLVRVFLRHAGEVDPEPIALRPPATIADVAHQIHHELASRSRGARVWGPSARFDGQRVGQAHVVQDGDTVEILP